MSVFISMFPPSVHLVLPFFLFCYSFVDLRFVFVSICLPTSVLFLGFVSVSLRISLIFFLPVYLYFCRFHLGFIPCALFLMAFFPDDFSFSSKPFPSPSLAFFMVPYFFCSSSVALFYRHVCDYLVICPIVSGHIWWCLGCGMARASKGK